LPGSADPSTILRKGILGNFENIPPPLPSKSATSNPGEDGKPVATDLNSPEVNRANSEYGFNTIASDKVSMNRSIPDVRMEE
jgi:hypothetical protein